MPMPESVTNGIQSSVDDIYEKFVNKVSDNRSMRYEEVHAVAKGRIWSGEKAIKLGLVDKIGGLEDALDSASKFANIEDYKVIRYFKELDPLEVFIAELIDNLDMNIDLGKNSKKILTILNDGYKFIDNKKDVNMISYCFECEYFLPK